MNYSGFIALLLYFFLVALAPSCTAEKTVTNNNGYQSGLVDKVANQKTEALYRSLTSLAIKGIAFGHQDDTKNGIGWKHTEPSATPLLRSDVYSILGNYPALYGWDLINIAGFYTGAAVESEKALVRQLTMEAAERGGFNTFSWHYPNPVSKSTANWRDSPVEAVTAILPGGTHHQVFRNSLEQVAEFMNSLGGVPVIFRPFHEMNGDWFWWGKGHCTPEEYRSLYRFTITYLRDSLQVHNLIYAWSPDRGFTTKEEYLLYYPGDAYVDILGIDNYGDLAPGTDSSIATHKLQIVLSTAREKKKLAAFTETGLQNLTQRDWYTATLLPLLKRVPGFAYVMVWSNSAEAFWTPPLTHEAAADFRAFAWDPFILTNNRLPKLYR